MLNYNSEQLEAINACNKFINQGNSKEYFLIEGKAGTGKTTVIKEVIKNYRNKRIIAGALSHKAKYVIRESVEKDGINWVNYSSIAGMLDLQLDLETGTFKKLYKKSQSKKEGLNSYDIIIIDEASMVNEETIELLFKEKKKSAKVIFLGDIGQLPPIRTRSNPYYADWEEKDLGKNSPVFDTTNKVKLLTRVRQGEESPILPFADFFWENSISNNRIKNPANIKYRTTEINNKGALIFINETKELFKNLLNVFDHAIKNNKPNLIKFVTYKNDTRTLINKYIHAHFFGANCKTFEKGELIIFNDNYGDIENSSEFQIVERYPEFIDKKDELKLYCIDIKIDNLLHQLVLLHPDSKKDYEIYLKNKFNTAFAIKKQIDDLDQDKKDYIGLKNTLTKQYRTELENAWAEKNRFPNIDYAYCLSSHRSQGSTYDIVVVHEQDIMNVKPITNKEKSQSIYTAITRAKNISIIISSERIYNNSVDISDIDILEINNTIENNKNDLRSITLQSS